MAAAMTTTNDVTRGNLNGHRYMATGKWPKDDQKKNTPIVFAPFRLFSLVFDGFRTFSTVFALFVLSVSDRFWRSVFALFCTIRLLPFSSCYLDSPEWRLCLLCANAYPLFRFVSVQREFRTLQHHLSGLPSPKAKSQRFSYAISQNDRNPAPGGSSKSQF